MRRSMRPLTCSNILALRSSVLGQMEYTLSPQKKPQRRTPRCRCSARPAAAHAPPPPRHTPSRRRSARPAAAPPQDLRNHAVGRFSVSRSSSPLDPRLSKLPAGHCHWLSALPLPSSPAAAPSPVLWPRSAGVPCYNLQASSAPVTRRSTLSW